MILREKRISKKQRIKPFLKFNFQRIEFENPLQTNNSIIRIIYFDIIHSYCIVDVRIFDEHALIFEIYYYFVLIFSTFRNNIITIADFMN